MGSESESVVRTRVIVKARRVAGSVVISLPLSIRRPLRIEAGDKVLVEVDTRRIIDRLIITKE